MFRLHMMCILNGQRRVNFSMMIHLFVQKMEEILFPVIRIVGLQKKPNGIFSKNSVSGISEKTSTSFDTVKPHLHHPIRIPLNISGCLVTQQTAESSISLETCTLMGGISGYIGLLLQLPPTLYQLLMSLQIALSKHVPSVGKIDHAAWRSFESDGRSDVSSGFVDGDLIETYLDLPKAMQQKLSEDLHVSFFFYHSLFDRHSRLSQGENNISIHATVEELVKIIEELARIH